MLGILIVALVATIFAGTKWSDATWTPSLALDLEGGTQIILEAKPVGDQEVTSNTITQAIDVIRQRVDSSGVSEAEITSQGSDQIIVGLPGKPSEETLALVRTSAQMEFRPVLATGAPTTATAEDPAAAPTPTASAGAAAQPSPAASDQATAPAEEATPAPSPSASAPASDAPAKSAPDNNSDAAYYVTPAVQEEFDQLDCTDPKNRTGGATGDPAKAFVTCDPEGAAKYILGPVEIEGSEIASASSGLKTLPSGGVSNEWVVNLKMKSKGTTQFTDVTTRLQGLTEPQNRFAMVLDGLVISSPSLAPGVIISNGQAEISGSFTRESAATLANQLNFGALPVTFEVQSQEQISATLGAEQLQKGLIAGLIGLILVVIYSMLQYRALGLLTVASLVVAAALTYGIITLLSWTQGYRLSLPGVAGLIVAIGITADSFIVYFERIRDELREGRTLGAAVDRGWERARRTILASDAVNFLAAIVLYLLAVGGVRGFAFTLGLTTIIDVVVVFLFTHPMMQLIARVRFFNTGHPLSGLDPRRLGVEGSRYVGRGKVVSGAGSTAGSAADTADAGGAAAPAPATRVPVGVGGGQTIAERRAAAKAAEQDASTAPPPTSGGGADDTPPEQDAESGRTEPGRTEGSEH
ncbi:protein translocase subunit SecD [Cellulomonas sp. URHB0016]